MRNQSAIEKDMPGFDQLLTKMIQTDNETNGTQQNCETLNLFDDVNNLKTFCIVLKLVSVKDVNCTVMHFFFFFYYLLSISLENT